MATQANNAIWIDTDESNFISLVRNEKSGNSNFNRHVFGHSLNSHNSIHKPYNEYSSAKSVSLFDYESVLSLSPSTSDKNMDDMEYCDYMENMMDVSSASPTASEIFSHTNEDFVDVNNAASTSTRDIFSQPTNVTNEPLVFRFEKDPFLGSVVVRLPLDTQVVRLPLDTQTVGLHETSDQETQFNPDDVIGNFKDLSTKDKLKLNILRKCSAEGKDIDKILHQCHESAKKEAMPSELDKAKEDHRKQRNRLSAKKSRDLKKAEYEDIKKKHQELLHKNEEEKKDLQDLEQKARTLEEFINTHNLHPHINQESDSEQILDTDYSINNHSVENLTSYSGQDISLNEKSDIEIPFETLEKLYIQYCTENKQDILSNTALQIQSNQNLFVNSMAPDQPVETITYQVQDLQYTNAEMLTYQIQDLQNMLPAEVGFHYNQDDCHGETTDQCTTHSVVISADEQCVTQSALQGTHGQFDAQPSFVSGYEQCDMGPALLSKLEQSNMQQPMQPALWSMSATSRRICDSTTQNPHFPITYSKPIFETAQQSVVCIAGSGNQQEPPVTGLSHNSIDSNQVKLINPNLTKKTLGAWQVDCSGSDEELMDLTNSFIEEPVVKKRKLDGDTH